MEGGYRWENCRDGRVPDCATKGGVDGNIILYVGRAFHQGDLLPGKIAPSLGCAYVSWGGLEIKIFEYEALICDDPAWVEDRDGSVPFHAIHAGRTSKGEELFVGRTIYNGTVTCGKIQPSNKCLYIPYAGKEISFSTYEVLVNMHQ